MADEAFALSPMSARPSPPSEADFEAIREAFAETARGRWFLNEYAKRNRNADTRMVLDAVARVEETMAARTQPTADPGESFEAIKAWVVRARADAGAALVSPDRDAALISGRKGARAIREIAWSLRETGTDPRICNILDSQIEAVEALQPLADDDGRHDAIVAIFDSLLAQVGALAGDDAPSQSLSAFTGAPRMPVEAVVPAEVDLAVQAENDHAPATIERTAGASFDVPEVEFPLTPTDSELAEDDAVLDRIAMEMSALDDAHHDDNDFDSDDADLIALKHLAPTLAPAHVEPAPSLGAALLANGVVRAPMPSGADAFAPFRRMSQAEKMAFFS